MDSGVSLMKSQLESKRLGVVDLLKLTWSIFLDNFAAFAVLALFLGLIVVFAGSGGTAPMHENLSPEELIKAKGMENFNVMRLIESLVGLLFSIAVYYIADAHIKGKKISPLKAMQDSAPYWLTAIVVSLIATVIIGVGTLLLIIPGVIVMVYLTFCVQAAVLRKQTIVESLKYSKKIVDGNWWHVLSITIAMGVLAILLSLLVNLPNTVFLSTMQNAGINADAGMLGISLQAVLVSLITIFFQITELLLFLNLDYIKK